jgi:hypothetical protein
MDMVECKRRGETMNGELILPRRRFLIGAASALGLLSAPAIVRASSLMPVSAARVPLTGRGTLWALDHNWFLYSGGFSVPLRAEEIIGYTTSVRLAAGR